LLLLVLAWASFKAGVIIMPLILFIIDCQRSKLKLTVDLLGGIIEAKKIIKIRHDEKAVLEKQIASLQEVTQNSLISSISLKGHQERKGLSF